jgi:hypothetical protein
LERNKKYVIAHKFMRFMDSFFLCCSFKEHNFWSFADWGTVFFVFIKNIGGQARQETNFIKIKQCI